MDIAGENNKTMIDWSQYMSLKEMARLINRPYKTLFAYVSSGKLPAKKRNGTRWFVHKNIISEFEQGGIDVSGSFRKRN